MDDWSNRKLFGVHMSRYCASWINSGGDPNDIDSFIEWIMSIEFKIENGTIEHISEDDAYDAYNMMTCGRMELEHSVKEFLEKQNNSKAEVV